LHDGQVICVGTPDEVARDPKVRDTYLGERFWNSPAPVTEIARG